MTLEMLIGKCEKGMKIKLVIDNGNEDTMTRHFESVVEFGENIAYKKYKNWWVVGINCQHDYMVITINESIF